MKLPKLDQIALLCMALVIGFAGYRFWSSETKFTKLETKVAKTEEKRAKAALKEETTLAKQEAVHAVETTTAVKAHDENEKLRADSLVSELARVDRLRINEERRFSTYRAQAKSNAAVCAGLADRLEALDRNTVEGVAVVEELRSALGKRDSEVVLLRSTIDADRKLMARTDSEAKQHAQTQ